MRATVRVRLCASVPGNFAFGGSAPLFGEALGRFFLRGRGRAAKTFQFVNGYEIPGPKAKLIDHKSLSVE